MDRVVCSLVQRRTKKRVEELNNSHAAPDGGTELGWRGAFSFSTELRDTVLLVTVEGRVDGRRIEVTPPTRERDTAPDSFARADFHPPRAHLARKGETEMDRFVDWMCQRPSPIGSPDLLERWYRTYWSDPTHQTAEDGNTMLHELVADPDDGTAEMVAYLIEEGANPNARNAAGRSPLLEMFADPLHDGLGWHDLAVARSLLEGGAQIGATDAAGDNVLHKAMRRLRSCGRGEVGEDIVELLVDSRADRNALNLAGETPGSILDDWFEATRVDDVLDRLDGLRSPAEVFLPLFFGCARGREAA